MEPPLLGALEILDLSNNSRLEGSLPAALALDAPNLTVLTLSSNYLSGTIPPGMHGHQFIRNCSHKFGLAHLFNAT